MVNSQIDEIIEQDYLPFVLKGDSQIIPLNKLSQRE